MVDKVSCGLRDDRMFSVTMVQVLVHKNRVQVVKEKGTLGLDIRMGADAYVNCGFENFVIDWVERRGFHLSTVNVIN